MRSTRIFYLSLIVGFVFILQHQHILPSFPFSKSKKVERIADAGYQEWLYTRNPLTQEVDKSGLVALDLESSSRSTANLFWESVGPEDVAGRVRELSIDKLDDGTKKVWVGSASGGLWTSEDIYDVNAQWEPVDDFLASLSVCAIAQSPQDKDIMYFGTGEGYFDYEAFPGAGMYMSEDRGNNWTYLQSTNSAPFKYIQDILILADGSLLVSTLHGGVMKSLDNGANWHAVLNENMYATSNTANKIIQLADGHLIASMGIHEQDGLYLSTDKGETWVSLELDKFVNGFTRVECSVSSTDPNIIFAVLADEDGRTVKALLKSEDKGGTWRNLPLPEVGAGKEIAGYQAWYNLSLAVHPSNPNKVLLGGIDLFASTNGGDSWEQISNWSGTGVLPKVHADQHTIEFVNNKDALIGNDGGVYLLKDGFTDQRQFIKKNNGLNITQCYDVAAHPQRSTIHFGTQDNGTQRITDFDLVETEEITGGDGGRVYFDTNDPNIQISSYLKNQYYVSVDGGEQFYYRSFNNDGLFINPTDYDPSRKILYGADEKGVLFRWNDPASLGVNTDKVVINNIYDQQITAVSVSKTNADRIYIGTEHGDVQRLEFAFIGTNRTGFNTLDLPDNHVISDIAENPTNGNHLIVSLSNYGVTSLYETKDLGKNWTAIEGNLPDVPVRDVLFLPSANNTVLIATEIGIFMSENVDGSNTFWTLENLGMANVRVDKVHWHPHRETVLAATFGRGIYEASLDKDISFYFQEDALDLYEEATLEGSGVCNAYHTVIVNVNASRPVAEETNLEIELDHLETNPSDIRLVDHILHFQKGELQANVLLEVADDLMVEDQERFRLTLGDEQGTAIEGILASNDKEPAFDGGGGSFNLGVQEKNSPHFPFKGYYEDAKSQCIITADELKKMGLSGESHLGGLSLFVDKKYSSKPFEDFSISVAHTNLANCGEVGEYLAEESFVNCFSSTIQTHEGWNDFSFATPFTWDGISNIIVQFCFDNSRWSSNDLVATYDAGFYCTQYDYRDSHRGCSLDRIRRKTTKRPIMKWTTLQTGEEICTDHLYLRSTVEPDEIAVFANNDLGLAASVIAEVEDCVSLTIDGTGTQLVKANWDQNVQRIEKSFFVEQEANGNHALTLYFSDQELQHLDTYGHWYLAETEGPAASAIDLTYTHQSELDWALIPGQGIAINVLSKKNTGYTLTLEAFEEKHTTTRNKRLHLSNVTVYPNPFQDRITIDFSEVEATDKWVSILSPEGKVLKKVSLDKNQNQCQLDLDSSWPPGSYYLHVDAGEGASWVKRILKL